MDEFGNIKQKTQQNILTGVLWLITAVLGAFSFFAGRRMVMSTFSRFFSLAPAGGAQTGRDAYSMMNILISFPLAFLVIAIVIGGFEYHFRRAGTEASRWMFARTLAIETGILLLALFL